MRYSLDIVDCRRALVLLQELGDLQVPLVNDPRWVVYLVCLRCLSI